MAASTDSETAADLPVPPPPIIRNRGLSDKSNLEECGPNGVRTSEDPRGKGSAAASSQ